ncbi:MAG: hypothetical protein R6W78_13015 [Bacteroidales bacterium]
MNKKTYEKASSYLKNLKTEKLDPGFYLHQGVLKKDIAHLSPDEFIETIVRTKKPQIFAESAVHGDVSDWNQTELSIMGDISVAVPVKVFDNGRHYHPDVHKVPFDATLFIHRVHC